MTHIDDVDVAQNVELRPQTANLPGKLVAIGGGRGACQVLLGAQPYFPERTAVVAVTDTGRSTGVVRTLSNMPAPGDLRNTLAALARDPDGLMARLLEHRFHNTAFPALDGMAVGNLLLAALTEMTGDLAHAVEVVGTLVQSMARVLPVSVVNTNLCAELADGTTVTTELEVRGLDKPPIRRLFLFDPDAPAYAPVIEAIATADVITLGPGSFFTSVLATLLFKGVIAALRETKAMVVFVCNTTTQPGQTDNYRAIDHVCRIVELLGPDVLDAVLINCSTERDPQVLDQYAAEGIHLLQPDDEEIARIAALGVRPYARDYAEQRQGKRQLWNKQDTIRHDPDVLGQALWKLALDRADLAE